MNLSSSTGGTDREKGCRRVAFAGHRQTGKTTLALNLGVTLARMGHRCLLVDLGEDADLTYGCGITPDEKPDNGIDLVLYRRHTDEEATRLFLEMIRSEVFPGVDLFPGNRRMREFDVYLHFQAGSRHGQTTQLRNVLESVGVAYDFILIDCLTTFGNLMTSAITAAQALLLPVDSRTTEYSLRQTHEFLQGAPTEPHLLQKAGIVFNKHGDIYLTGEGYERIAEAAAQRWGWQVFKTWMPLDGHIWEGSEAGKPSALGHSEQPSVYRFGKLAEEMVGWLAETGRPGNLRSSQERDMSGKGL